jgi:multisubunit Na+/H+ antiporter MnhF subunit
MEHLPFYISLVMGLSTFLSVYFLAKASPRYTTRILVIATIWLVIQTLLGTGGFYTNTQVMPPRFLLTIGPPMLLIIGLFVTKRGQAFINGLNLKTLTILHIVRVPVELVLFWLFLHKAVPEIMTFEGQNFDILSGITAPIIYYLFKKEYIGAGIMLLWNFVCLVLLINIVSTAILSAPFPFQQLAFEQPNIAVLYFPFNWLPACIVPIVLFSHLVAIRHLLRE